MSDGDEPKLATGLRWAGLVIVLLAVFVRVLVAFDPLPHWSIDPVVMNIPMTEVGPAASLALDAVTFLGLALVLAAVGIARERTPWIALLLMGVGLVPIVWHAGGMGGGRDLGDTWLGFNWASAIASAVAAMVACRDVRLRRIAVASLLGVSFMLVGRGALQYFIEHAATLAAFEQTKAAFFASKGWDENSAMAQSYVRRLVQPEATGWFGLANVYATVMASSLVGLCGFAACAVHARAGGDDELTGGWVALIVAGALACAVGLYLSGSRAGLLALASGGSMLALAWVAGRTCKDGARARWGRRAGVLSLGLAVGVVALVAIQPALGDRAVDLSLRFRGFYMWGASRIALDHPLAGVGPGGFQDAYMLAKQATAPENVASPHSVVFDLLACLGVGGGAWVAIWAMLAFGAGRGVMAECGGEVVRSTWRERRIDFVVLLVLTAVPTLLSAWIESAATTPDRAIARIIGLAGWVGLSIACVAFMRRVPFWTSCAAAAGVALIVHAQLDVAPVTFGSSAWMLAMLGALAAGTSVIEGAEKTGDQGVGTAPHTRVYRGMAAASLVGLVSLFIVGWAWVPTARFERHLAEAADAIRPYSEIQSRISRIQIGASEARGDSMGVVASDLGRMLGIAQPQTQESFGLAMVRLLSVTSTQASGHLASAMESYPANVSIGAARARLALRRAEILYRSGGSAESGRAEIEAALEVVEGVSGARPDSPGAWSSLASTAWRASRIDPERHEALMDRAIGAWKRAADLDPHGVIFPAHLHDAYTEVGDIEQAKAWAVRALDADDALVLDPLVGLTDADRTRLEQTARNP